MRLAILQDPSDCKNELGTLATMMTEGPMPARTSATKEVEEVLEADPTVTGYDLASLITTPLLLVIVTDSLHASNCISGLNSRKRTTFVRYSDGMYA